LPVSGTTNLEQLRERLTVVEQLAESLRMHEFVCGQAAGLGDEAELRQLSEMLRRCGLFDPAVRL
jgi:hypothetical protein